MSNNTNQQLLERAAEMVEFWEGTLHAELIRYALDQNDLELVWYNVTQAEAEASREIHHDYDLLPESEMF